MCEPSVVLLFVYNKLKIILHRKYLKKVKSQTFQFYIVNKILKHRASTEFVTKEGCSALKDLKSFEIILYIDASDVCRWVKKFRNNNTEIKSKPKQAVV